MEMINNNENNDQMESASMPTQRWWSVVGDNGFGIIVNVNEYTDNFRMK